MVAAAHRISRGSDFDRTLRAGVRVTTRDLVVHVLPLSTVPTDLGDPRNSGVAVFGGPWLGLIVNKAVGNAVVRHRVARRLRAAFASSRDSFPITETMMVVRARPSAADCDSPALAGQLVEALGRRRVRDAFASTEDRILR
ncbi:ribonuclease P protein component [Gordonia sp. PKS22-38]|uniref:Ribonuclease P protein component n=1 Tax=Gordonia prachuapensis TaxID=3115651 RepID=A0ABU7N092_9ACTN|nr:ribonuclease P protein component [Gordonia sp. PKS22-38]